jgi:hypothetical protein
MLPSTVCLMSLRNTARNCSHSRRVEFEISGGGTILRLVRQEAIAVILLNERLRSKWHHGMLFEATVKLRDDPIDLPLLKRHKMTQAVVSAS